MTKVIGLTGGIGSGKSSVLQLFAEFGVPYYIADIEAKRLMQTDPVLRRSLIEAFGEKTFDTQGHLNTGYLAGLVFSDKEKLKRLNTLVHPVVHNDFKEFIQQVEAPYLIYENAILFESGADDFCDYIILVTAPEEERISRVVKRDGSTEEQVRARINNQIPEEEKSQRADYIIENIDRDETRRQVEKLHRFFIQKFRN